MEKILSIEEKEDLIAKLWVDKKGKKDGPSNFALYLALDNPRPNLATITADMLTALAADPFDAQQWARTWGRVVVCVGPGGKPGCILGNINEDANKRFIPVSTKEKISTDGLYDLIKVMPEGNLGVININNQPTTIEGFLISYVHMVDEFIWEIYRKNGEVGYRDAVDLVRESGFLVNLASEDEILLGKSQDINVSVRLYGSKVNKDVPRVMGSLSFVRSEYE